MPRMIDADALHTSIALYAAENAYLNDTALDVLEMVSKWLNEAPAINAEPVRHGTWLWRGGIMMKCSVCGRIVPKHRYKGCPHCLAIMKPYCGAKMDRGGTK